MSHETKLWHSDFIEYMNEIANHPNYEGLPIVRKKDGSISWIASAKSEVGRQRIEWAMQKAKEFGFKDEPGVYAKVMLEIHPMKQKPCQICGKWMSLYYHYPSANFVKSLNKIFKGCYTMTDHIADIYDNIAFKYKSENGIKEFLIQKGELNLTLQNSKDEIISTLEEKCRCGDKAFLSPGAMSNFPDRYDGFHTYNRCCRSGEDKGRSKENLKSYTKDRRAYEYWSDGNIHAANQFMGSDFFKDCSADHIGPISLGFVHDPRYLQPMSGSDNSAKRDRLQFEDIEKIIEIENHTGIYSMSWQSREIWETIKRNYKENKRLVATVYRDALKQNMANYMYILGIVIRNCKDIGKDFLEEILLKPHYAEFDFSYKFNENGEIISKEKRHFTERNRDELERYKRIAFDSVGEYNLKENRNTEPDLTDEEKFKLESLCKTLNYANSFLNCKSELKELVLAIQRRLIKKMQEIKTS